MAARGCEPVVYTTHHVPCPRKSGGGKKLAISAASPGAWGPRGWRVLLRSHWVRREDRSDHQGGAHASPKWRALLRRGRERTNLAICQNPWRRLTLVSPHSTVP